MTCSRLTTWCRPRRTKDRIHFKRRPSRPVCEFVTRTCPCCGPISTACKAADLHNVFSEGICYVCFSLSGRLAPVGAMWFPWVRCHDPAERS